MIVSSLFWWVFKAVGLQGPLAGIIPGVLAQIAFRCWFVAIYHRLEKAIQHRLQRQEAEDAQCASPNETAPPNTVDSDAAANRNDRNKSNWTEVANKLRLELNVVSCGIAAGAGFGDVHAILLYGTLLAS
jgi:hypothetical protein